MTNRGKITTMNGAGVNTGLVDQTDKMHTGLIKALEAFDKGDKCIGHAGFTIDHTGTYTRFNLAQPIHFTSNNQYSVYGSSINVAYSSDVQHDTYTRYDLVSLVPNLGSNPSLVITQGTLVGANALVGEIPAGNIPIALIEITAGSDNTKTNYNFQLYTFDTRKNSLSLGYETGGYYAETAKIVSSASGTLLTNSIGDFTIDNTDNNDQIIMQLGSDNSDTAFQVKNDNGDVNFSVDGAGTITGLPVSSVANGSNDRLATFTGANGIRGETNLNFGTNSQLGVVGNIWLTPPNDHALPSINIDHLDADQEVIDIDSSTTTANVLDISTSTLTTGNVLNLVSTSTPADTAGSIPHSLKTTQAGTGTHTIKGMMVDVIKNGATASGKTNTLTGIHLDVKDTVTNDASGTVNITGLDIDVIQSNGQGTTKNIGLDVTVETSAGSSTNYAALFNGGKVGIGTTAPQATLHIESTDSSTYQLLVESTEAGSSAAPDFGLLRDSSSPANGDDLGHVKFLGRDSGGNTTVYADMFSEIQTVTNGSEDGKLHFRTLKNASTVNRISMVAGETVINEDGVDIDFRVEGNSDPELIVADAGEDKVGIGITPTAAHTAKLSLEGSMMIKERPAATADLATYGQLWVKEVAPNQLYFTNDAGNDIRLDEEVFIISLSDETTNLTTGDGKAYFNMPFAMTLTAVKATVNTAPAGSTIIVDIEEAGSTILTTLLTIDAGEKTSSTAATAAVIGGAGPALANDAEIKFNIDQIGSSTAGKGLKVTLYGYRT